MHIELNAPGGVGTAGLLDLIRIWNLPAALYGTIDLMSDTRRTAAGRAEDFHATMARVVLQQAEQVRAAHGVQQVALCGGVFQNRVLTEAAIKLLEGSGFDVWLPVQLPCNDAALSFGQAAEFAARGVAG